MNTVYPASRQGSVNTSDHNFLGVLLKRVGTLGAIRNQQSLQTCMNTNGSCVLDGHCNLRSCDMHYSERSTKTSSTRTVKFGQIDLARRLQSTIIKVNRCMEIRLYPKYGRTKIVIRKLNKIGDESCAFYVLMYSAGSQSFRPGATFPSLVYRKTSYSK